VTRTAGWIAVAVALAAAGYLFLRDAPRAPSDSTPLRPSPAVPSPTVEGKIAYFHGLLRSGKTLDLKAPLTGATPLEIPVWREIGGSALLGIGEPALAFLVSPARQPEYLAAPYLLVSVLQLLAEAPPSPGLFPFLAHWLDEGNCPKAVPGSDWPEEIRVHAFAALRAHAVPEAAPLCIAELDRPWRAHDLRGAAIDILLQLGAADVLNKAYRTLPPTPDQPEPDLRAAVLTRLFQMAAPAAGERNRAQVAALKPLLEEALASPRTVERVDAMGILHRLGEPGMGDALERFFEENREDEVVAWTALLFLSADDPVPYVREACLARVAKADSGIGFTTAVRLLAKWWPEEIVPQFDEWVRLGVLDPYMVLGAMLRVDRAKTVQWLRGQMKTPDMDSLLRALSFIAGERVTELAPDLLDLVRRLGPSQRPPVYNALVALRAPGTEALLLAELSAGVQDDLRSAAAVELLNLGGDEGHARLATLVAGGDGAVLDAILRRARMLGERGVPPPVVPAVLAALRTLKGEDGRRAALLVLRFRGRFDDVREALLEAYRFEPSRRVAKEIGETIDELAHR
jgi:hypothetical protein